MLLWLLLAPPSAIIFKSFLTTLNLRHFHSHRYILIIMLIYARKWNLKIYHFSLGRTHNARAQVYRTAFYFLFLSLSTLIRSHSHAIQEINIYMCKREGL